MQSSHDGNAGRISDVTVVVDNVNIGSDRPAADTLQDAQRFSVESVRMADDAVKSVGGVCLDVVSSVEVVVRTN